MVKRQQTDKKNKIDPKANEKPNTIQTLETNENSTKRLPLMQLFNEEEDYSSSE